MANSTNMPRISYAITDNILNTSDNNYNFAIPFAFENSDDIKIILDNGDFITDFTTSFNSNSPDSGSVNILKEKLIAAKNIYIYRDMALIRETEFQADSDFRAAIINGEFDRIIWLLQQMDMQVSGAIHRPQHDVGGDLTLPDAKVRKNKLLAFNDDGAVIVMDDSQTSAINALATAKDAALSAIASATSATKAETKAISIKNMLDNIENFIIKDKAITNIKLADKTITNDKLADSQIGKHSIYMPAGAILPTKTNGAKSKTTHLAGDIKSISTLDFSGSLVNGAQFSIAMPKSWDEGALQFQIYWLCNHATITNGATFKIAACSIEEMDSFTKSFGAETSLTMDATDRANDLIISDISGDLIVKDAAVNNLAFFEISRDVSDAGDTIAADAKLIGINLTYTTITATDN